MTEKSQRFWLGFFVVMSVAVLLTMVWLFGGLPRSILTPHSQYTIRFPEAAGVGPGTPVRRSGVRIGEVRKIELDDNTGEVLVTIEVLAKHGPRPNETAILTRGVFGGDTAIDIGPEPLPDHENSEQGPEKKAPPQPLPPGAEIRGKVQPDLAKSMEGLNRLADSLNRLADPTSRALNELTVTAKTWGGLGENLNVLLKTNEEKLVKTLDNVNETAARMAQLLNEENQRNFAATLKNVRNASEGLDSLTKSTDLLMRDSRDTLKQVNSSLKQIDQVMTNLDKVTRPLADRGDTLARNLEEITVRLNKVLADMQDITKAFGQNDGTLQRLLSDPALYNNLDSLLCGLARQVPRLERILKDAEVFADKIARHPEALGVGGVVRPGSGVK